MARDMTAEIDRLIARYEKGLRNIPGIVDEAYKRAGVEGPRIALEAIVETMIEDLTKLKLSG